MNKAKNTQASIIQSAIWVFAHYGMMEGSFQRIADRSKISQSAIFRYYKNKSELINATIKQIVIDNHGLVSKFISPDQDSVTQLKNHFFGNLEWGKKHPEQARMLLMIYHLACFDPIFLKIYTELLSGARLRIKGYLFAAVREKRLAQNTDLDHLAALLHEALMGNFINSLTVESKTLLKSKSRLESVLNVFFS